MDQTPRQRGLIDEVYALVAATKDFTDPQGVIFAAQAQQLESDLENMWAPIFQAGGIQTRADALGQAIADQYTIENPLDVPTSEGVATPEDDAFASGGVGANLSAFGSDVASSASSLASSAGALASSTGSTLVTVIKWAAIAAAALVVIDLAKHGL